MPNEAMDHLDGTFTEELGYIFWKDAVSLQDESLLNRSPIRDGRLLTEIYLLGLTVKNNGRFVTFDHSIPWRAVPRVSERHPELPEQGSK